MIYGPIFLISPRKNNRKSALKSLVYSYDRNKPLDHLYILINKKYRKMADFQDIKTVGGTTF